MTEKRFDIFPTPLWVGNFYNKDMIEDINKLSYEFRENTTEAALLSDSWNHNEMSSSMEDFKRKGVTSFASADLVNLWQWRTITNCLHTCCKELLNDEWDIPEDGQYVAAGMRLSRLWTTIYSKDCFVPEHIHSNSLLSGIYYTKTPENCGDVVFRDPSWVAKSVCNPNGSQFPSGGTNQNFTPNEGDLLLFPSWLPHFSEPNKNEEDRIMVAFNLDFTITPEKLK